MSSQLILYIDWASQPSRAIVAFCRLNKIPHQVVETRIAKGDHKSPEFLKINPNGQVPAIKDGDFCLSESHAILRYLAESRGLTENWYPKDLKKRAIVDQYLDWHHTMLRQGAAGFVFRKTFGPKLTGKTYTEEELNFHETYLKRSLNLMERWLSQSQYLCGNEKTIADISASHELDQTKFLAYDLTKWPKVKQWLHKMIDEDPI